MFGADVPSFFIVFNTFLPFYRFRLDILGELLMFVFENMSRSKVDEFKLVVRAQDKVFGLTYIGIVYLDVSMRNSFFLEVCYDLDQLGAVVFQYVIFLAGKMISFLDEVSQAQQSAARGILEYHV